MDNRLFRDAMGKFATGITIVTTEYNGEIMGMTVNAFMSVSLDPKLIAISIDEKARMYDKLQVTKKFGLSILTEDQKDLSMIFAKQINNDREIAYLRQDNIPVLDASIATLSCHVKETANAGDHMIFIAEVTDVKMNGGDPILFYGGQYHTLD
ncbi:NADH-FMN oxidoreductase RutF, flavin reductase (DIM6/NTAB) family [Virgibacillus subterraneus]|uniref:NADH-FMN oxidoreductase RutF, flavin reductase (DIM6/NTAB) family n=1 Tax=Virgibacillus subterraneus TaxID=621109 RepID=A0A1H9GWV6_9BACI|nr:flavin reductase family protein [Virgibacillus subterraneus]SEQ54535.1 NADH-FMN oxidoreductase RutF, flavin reductase (DIM6/NTAB) family [Virgibacillus subterraneus]